MGRLVNNKGMVRMSKDGVTHDFVLESVPVWEALGWKPTSENEKKDDNPVAQFLADNASEVEVVERNPEIVAELSNEPKAVTGPKTAQKK